MSSFFFECVAYGYIKSVQFTCTKGRVVTANWLQFSFSKYKQVFRTQSCRTSNFIIFPNQQREDVLRHFTHSWMFPDCVPLIAEISWALIAKSDSSEWNFRQVACRGVMMWVIYGTPNRLKMDRESHEPFLRRSARNRIESFQGQIFIRFLKYFPTICEKLWRENFISMKI